MVVELGKVADIQYVPIFNGGCEPMFIGKPAIQGDLSRRDIADSNTNPHLGHDLSEPTGPSPDLENSIPCVEAPFEIMGVNVKFDLCNRGSHEATPLGLTQAIEITRGGIGIVRCHAENSLSSRPVGAAPQGEQ
jgi:hypothetical protein